MTRDMVGYGEEGSQVRLPDSARIAVNFVINYEEGAENSPVYGDAHAEIYGGEFALAQKPKGVRSLSMESLFEYGSRAGIWRLTRLFDKYQIPLTFFVTGFALEQNPEFAAYLRTSEHEVAGHGWRWVDYADMSKAEEKKQIKQCVKVLHQQTGKEPVGWYTGRRSEHTRKILLELGGFLYDSDSYADDYPYFEKKHLIVPYSLVTNDFRYQTTPGFSAPNDFFQQLKQTFDYLYQENRGAMMSIGLHARISGHPARTQAVQQFIEYIQSVPDVWITRRMDIASHWMKQLSVR
ncbi:MAG: polysaccharide deacetylase family protein [Gammaproteobacteria bacterium]|nr:polysaccharide deacetylase family protein [Gammaproteobacteria bacterium]